MITEQMKELLKKQALVPGTKVDIRLLEQDAANAEGKQSEGTYVSAIFDIEDDDTLVLDMPQRAGRMVLVPLGLRYELIFNTRAGLMKAEALVTNRVRRRGFYLLIAELITDVEKHQRREYYRLNTMMPLNFITLDDRAGRLEKMADIQSVLNDDGEIPLMYGTGTILNISGGGMRFITEQNLEGIRYLFLQFTIENGDVKRNVALIGEIVGEVPLEDKDKGSYRIRLLYKDSRCQELIIRYIFEQERKIRKKALG